MGEKKEIQNVENKEILNQPQISMAESNPVNMIQMAISNGADLEKLEKLLSLQERWEGNEAKKAYHVAMAKFKENPPKIEKDKKVGYVAKGATVGYSHASLANVTEKINKSLSENGLSASWTTKQNGAISVTCHITHSKGHSEQTTLTAGSDTTGSKNSIQAIGSTITYLQRYTLLSLTGLATYDMDNDGSTETDTDTEEEFNVRKEVLAKANNKFKTANDFVAWRKKNNFPESFNACTNQHLTYMLEELDAK